MNFKERNISCYKPYACCLTSLCIRSVLKFSVNFVCPLQVKEFEIIGRGLPSEKNPSPPLFKMRIFAPDEVVAKSKYWYFVAKLKKIKKSHGEVVSCKQVCVHCR